MSRLAKMMGVAFTVLSIDEQRMFVDQVREWTDRERHDRLFAALSKVKDELDNMEIAEKERREFVPWIPAEMVCARYRGRA